MQIMNVCMDKSHWAKEEHDYDKVMFLNEFVESVQLYWSSSVGIWSIFCKENEGQLISPPDNAYSLNLNYSIALQEVTRECKQFSAWLLKIFACLSRFHIVTKLNCMCTGVMLKLIQCDKGIGWQINIINSSN